MLFLHYRSGNIPPEVSLRAAEGLIAALEVLLQNGAEPLTDEGRLVVPMTPMHKLIHMVDAGQLNADIGARALGVMARYARVS